MEVGLFFSSMKNDSAKFIARYFPIYDISGIEIFNISSGQDYQRYMNLAI